MHDPRVGRFFAVDPLAPQYPSNSSYAFSENCVIDHVELEGGEKIDAIVKPVPKVPVFKMLDNNAVKELAKSGVKAAVSGQGTQLVAKKATESFGMRLLGIGGRLLGTAAILLTDSMSPNFGRTNEMQHIYSLTGGFKVDEKVAVPDLKIKEKTIEEVPIVRIGEKQRKKLAKDFLSKNDAINIDRHLKAINFDEEVYTKTLPEGTELFRWSRKSSDEPKEYFSFEKGFHPTEVGLQSSQWTDPSDWIFEKFTLTKETKVLISTINLDGEKGLKQAYSPEIQKNSTNETVTPNFE